jgi:hypothetical protein
VCDSDLADTDYAGCCENGCIEHMCYNCCYWDEEKSEVLCPTCAPNPKEANDK